MFSLVPTFLLIGSIAVVLIILLRRLPHVIVRDDGGQPDLKSVNIRSRNFIGFFARITSGIFSLWNWLSGHAHAAKDYRIKTNYLERMSSAILHAGRKKSTPPSQGNPVAPAATWQKEGNYHSTSEEEKKYIEAIATDPNDKAAYEGLGRAYTNRENYKDALEVYEYLTGSYPETDTYWSRLGLVYFKMSQFSRAASAYERAVDINPGKPARLVNLGLCYEALGDLSRAITVLERALRLAPDAPEYMTLLADLFIKDNKKEQAIAMLEKVLQIEPTNHAVRKKLMELKF